MDPEIAPASSAAAAGDVLVRQAVPGDLALVYKDWLLDYFEHSLGWCRGMKRADFDSFHRVVIDRLFARGARCIVACDPDAPTVVYGWLLSEPQLLHYVQVKRRFRHRGLGQQLLSAATLGDAFVYTHVTHVWQGLVHRHYPAARYLPYAL